MTRCGTLPAKAVQGMTILCTPPRTPSTSLHLSVRRWAIRKWRGARTRQDEKCLLSKSETACVPSRVSAWTLISSKTAAARSSSRSLRRQRWDFSPLTRAKKIITAVPHCVRSFKSDYAQLGTELEVFHYTEVISWRGARSV